MWNVYACVCQRAINIIGKIRTTFLKNTIGDLRIISDSSLKEIFKWLYDAYAVYDNMRSQKGGAILVVYGIIHCRLSEWKLNTNSLIESELVGTSDHVPFNVWLVFFLREQRYDIIKNILFQDNHSAINMEPNGKNSCNVNSRHIDIKYFFVKDKVDKYGIQIQYFPTHLMLADYFTKPLQGSLFGKFI